MCRKKTPEQAVENANTPLLSTESSSRFDSAFFVLPAATTVASGLGAIAGYVGSVAISALERADYDQGYAAASGAVGSAILMIPVIASILFLKKICCAKNDPRLFSDPSATKQSVVPWWIVLAPPITSMSGLMGTLILQQTDENYSLNSLESLEATASGTLLTSITAGVIAGIARGCA